MFRACSLAAALPLLLVSTGVNAEPCPQRLRWPTDVWPSRVELVAPLKSAQIAALDSYAFTRVGSETSRTNIRTDAVLIVQGGSIIYERYAPGHTRSNRHLTWSVSKSVVNALVGVAVQRGLLSVDDSICDHLDALKIEACDVSVDDLISFASGFDWAETYEGESVTHSSVIAMLYGEGRSDMARFVADHSYRAVPSTAFAYSSGDSTLLAAVVGAVLGVDDEGFPWTTLFDRIGAGGSTFERDNKGQFVGASYWLATPRDMARFGFLYLNDGCWDAQRILPEDWVDDSTEVTEVFRTLHADPEDEWVQGRQWWLNRAVPEQNIPIPWPEAPEDAFVAAGHWGQSITVIPSWDLVIVRVADDRDEDAFNLNRFLGLALAVAEEP